VLHEWQAPTRQPAGAATPLASARIEQRREALVPGRAHARAVEADRRGGRGGPHGPEALAVDPLRRNARDGEVARQLGEERVRAAEVELRVRADAEREHALGRDPPGRVVVAIARLRAAVAHVQVAVRQPAGVALPSGSYSTIVPTPGA
jgi:hypothetical protein